MYLVMRKAVERCVKLVTKSSSAVCGAKSRDGFIRSQLECRLINPTFNTKSDYRVLYPECCELDRTQNCILRVVKINMLRVIHDFVTSDNNSNLNFTLSDLHTCGIKV